MIATHPPSTGPRRGCLACVGKQVLVDLLSQDYPRDHEVIIYRAATLPILGPEIRRVALRDLPAAELTTEHTVVLPPVAPLRPNLAMRERLATLDRETAMV